MSLPALLPVKDPLHAQQSPSTIPPNTPQSSQSTTATSTIAAKILRLDTSSKTTALHLRAMAPPLPLPNFANFVKQGLFSPPPHKSTPFAWDLSPQAPACPAEDSLRKRPRQDTGATGVIKECKDVEPLPVLPAIPDEHFKRCFPIYCKKYGREALDMLLTSLWRRACTLHPPGTEREGEFFNQLYKCFPST